MIEVTTEGSGGVPLVFLHGWPDDPSLWDDLVARFVDARQCLRVQLPAYPGSSFDRGDDFPALVHQLEARLQELVGDQKVIFVGHDWGAILTYLFVTHYPDRLERVVTLDVGGHMQPPLRWMPVYVGYQWWLIAAEQVGKASPGIGDAMARWMAKQAHAPHPEKITANSGWAYRYAWRAILRPKYRRSLVFRFKPKHPHLFVYGTRKPFHFHSDWWLKTLEERDDCVVVSVPAGHWLMLKCHEEVFRAISDFVT